MNVVAKTAIYLSNGGIKMKAKRKLLWKGIRRDWQLMVLGAYPVLTMAVFMYVPMFGVLYAFQDVGLRTSFWENEWVGLQYFKSFFSSYYWVRLVKNTLTISAVSLVFGTISTIALALLVNEVKDGRFKRLCQTATYLPNFVSVAVMVGLLKAMTNPDGGIINLVLENVFQLEPIDFFQTKKWFLPMYVISGIWQGVGWGTIIYLGAISGIDPALYEAAAMDGCGRWGKIRYITWPGMRPIVVTMLILNIGSLLSVGYVKIMLMQTSINKEVSDVISLYVYQRGLIDGEFGFGTAVGLMNSVVNLILLLVANVVSKKVSETSLF